MKILIPLDEDRKSVCPSFGRAPYFMVYDSDSKKKDLRINHAAQEQGGAGIKAAQFVVDCEAQVLITPRCGENAAQVCRAAGIEIYQSQGLDADENVAAFLNGRLDRLNHFHGGFHGQF